MPGMIKRWLRRRLAGREAEEEPDAADEGRKRGALVRKGQLVTLRAHVPANRDAFQRWYADPEIAQLLRHDLEPLTSWQSRGYFDSFILPSSARGTCFAIHERKTKRLIGTTVFPEPTASPRSFASSSGRKTSGAGGMAPRQPGSWWRRRSTPWG
jgi:hypothetical protein